MPKYPSVPSGPEEGPTSRLGTLTWGTAVMVPVMSLDLVLTSVPNGPGMSKFSRIWPGLSLQAWLSLSLAGPGPFICHIGFFPAACMASADPLIASRHSVSTAKFNVNIPQLPNMIKNNGTISFY